MNESKKNKNKQRKISFPVYLLSLFIALVVGIGSTLFIQYEASDLLPVVGSGSSLDTSNLSSIDELYQILSDDYVEKIDKEILIEGALAGMAASIDDPYTEFLNEEQSTYLDEDISGSFQGIGAEVMKDGEGVRIISPIPHSPAEAAGLLANDLILSVDGNSVAELTITEAVELIRGPEGSEVVLEIERDDKVFKTTLTRAKVAVESVYSQISSIDSTVGYVQITKFNEPTYNEVITAIKSLEEQGIEKIVFDVRNNPGGLLNIALQIANIFVPDGKPLMQSLDRSDEEPVVYLAEQDLGRYKYKGKAVLLIDEGSASAAEILAGAMQSVDIPLIGQTTFGKGTIQTIHPLKHSQGSVKFTVGQWLTARGDKINEKGIQPDVEIVDDTFDELLAIDTSETLTEGDADANIKNLKNILSVLGYQMSDNSLYDKMTVEAVSDFQSTHDLSVTGTVASDTARKLIDAVRQEMKENDKQLQAAIEEINGKE